MATFNFSFKLLSLILLIVCLQFQVLAQERPAVIGGSQNTNFEKLSCSDIVKQQFKKQVVAFKENPNTRFNYSACKIKNKFLASAITVLNSLSQSSYMPQDVKECIQKIDKLKHEYEFEESYFIRAIQLKIEIIDVSNLNQEGIKRHLSTQCHLKAHSFVRDSQMSDMDYINKAQNICFVKVDDPAAIKKDYGNLSQYQERQACHQILDEYFLNKKNQGEYEPFRRFIKGDDSMSSNFNTKSKCKENFKINCKEGVRNFGGECYMQALEDCVLGVDNPSSNFGNAAGSANTGQ